MMLAIGVSLSILHVGPSSVLTLLYEIASQGIASELLAFLQFSINEHNWPANSQQIGLQPYLLQKKMEVSQNLQGTVTFL